MSDAARDPARLMFGGRSARSFAVTPPPMETDTSSPTDADGPSAQSIGPQAHIGARPDISARRPLRPQDLGVDILITNYNYGRYLREAIDSALSQDHPRVHVVVVDDGSTDGSREILRSYERRVDVLLKDNGGQASAFNAGLPRCIGDVVISLDADDVLDPRVASRAAAVFAANPDVVKVQWRMMVIDADGAPQVVKPPPHLPLPSGDMRRAELAFPFDIVWLPTSANAFRGDALRRILPIPAEDYGRCGADWYLNHLTALLGAVLSLDEVGGYYRVHGSNNYEPQSPSLDLAYIRSTICFARATASALTRLADRLGQPRPARVLSVSDAANRIISLRLAPDEHPVQGDGVPAILRDALLAIRRRYDVALLMRALFALWFACMALAPRPLARPLAELFLFPERRESVNRALRCLHRRPTGYTGHSAA